MFQRGGEGECLHEVPEVEVLVHAGEIELLVVGRACVLRCWLVTVELCVGLGGRTSWGGNGQEEMLATSVRSGVCIELSANFGKKKNHVGGLSGILRTVSTYSDSRLSQVTYQRDTPSRYQDHRIQGP
jgi:hypothetical protein